MNKNPKTDHLKATQFSTENQPLKNGRPKGSLSLKTLIRQVWEEEITDDQGNPKIKALLSIKAMVDKAENGDVQAFKALAERIEGLPKQKIETDSVVKVVMPTITKDGKEMEFNVGD